MEIDYVKEKTGWIMKRFPLRLNILAAVVLVLLLLPAAVHAMDAQVRIYVDGELVEAEDGAVMIDDHPYISEDVIQQHLGALTVWDSENRTLAIERDTYKARFVLYESYAVWDGEAVRLDAAPIVLSNRIYLPAEAVGKSLGIKVTWDIVNYGLQFYLPQGSISGWEEDPVPADLPVTEEEEIPAPSDSGRDVSKAGGSSSGAAVIHSIEMSGDQIIITADKELEANIFTLTDPYRIVIDLPESKIGSLLNGEPSQLSGQITATHPHIQRIRYSVFNDEPVAVRIVIDLAQPVQYAAVKQEDARKVALNIRSQSYQVVLDAGHGGKDPGAIAYSGRYEKDFTLPLTLKIYDLLLAEPFIQPVLTRADDTFVELDQRAQLANDLEADLFISIHGNTYIPSVHGTETYYYDPSSKRFADIIHRHVVDASGFRDRDVRKQEYKVLRLAQMPAVLVEIGYLSNKDQEAVMYDEAFQDKIAQAIVDAIKEYLDLEQS